VTSCLFGAADKQKKFDLVMTEDLIEIVQQQQYYIDNPAECDRTEYLKLIEKMARYYGVRPSDIKFIEMEFVGHKSLRKFTNSTGSNSLHPTKEIYKGFTIRGRKQGYGKLFYSNGNIKTVGIYKNDKLHGRNIKTYYSDGTLLHYEGDMVTIFPLKKPFLNPKNSF
jgi:hypothetical protein